SKNIATTICRGARQASAQCAASLRQDSAASAAASDDEPTRPWLRTAAYHFLRRKTRRAARGRPSRLLLLHEVEVGAALLAGGVDHGRLAGGVDGQLEEVEQAAIRRLVARLDRPRVDVRHDELRREAGRPGQRV